MYLEAYSRGAYSKQTSRRFLTSWPSLNDDTINGNGGATAWHRQVCASERPQETMNHSFVLWLCLCAESSFPLSYRLRWRSAWTAITVRCKHETFAVHRANRAAKVAVSLHRSQISTFVLSAEQPQRTYLSLVRGIAPSTVGSWRRSQTRTRSNCSLRDVRTALAVAIQRSIFD